MTKKKFDRNELQSLARYKKVCKGISSSPEFAKNIIELETGIVKLLSMVRKFKTIHLYLSTLFIMIISGVVTYGVVTTGIFSEVQELTGRSPYLENVLDFQGFIIEPVLHALVPLLISWSICLVFYKTIKANKKSSEFLIDICSLFSKSIVGAVFFSGAILTGMSLSAVIFSNQSGAISLTTSLLILIAGELLRRKSSPKNIEFSEELDKNHMRNAKILAIVALVLWAYLTISDLLSYLLSSIFEVVKRL
ncbi:hypothetical protein AB4281_19475 [Vibrio splendidus]